MNKTITFTAMIAAVGIGSWVPLPVLAQYGDQPNQYQGADDKLDCSSSRV